jgi:hypothetical protein
MKSSILIASVVLLNGSFVAFADDRSQSHTKTTNATGTTVTTDRSDEVTIDSDGARRVAEEKTVVDPKGILNKTTAESRTEKEVMNNGDYDTTTTRKRADGTHEEVTRSKATSDHWLDKGKTTTTTTTTVVDPKGLNNKQVIEETEKVVTDGKGSVERLVKK